jgi:hypothetical protein
MGGTVPRTSSMIMTLSLLNKHCCVWELNISLLVVTVDHFHASVSGFPIPNARWCTGYGEVRTSALIVLAETSFAPNKFVENCAIVSRSQCICVEICKRSTVLSLRAVSFFQLPIFSSRLHIYNKMLQTNISKEWWIATAMRKQGDKGHCSFLTLSMERRMLSHRVDAIERNSS